MGITISSIFFTACAQTDEQLLDREFNPILDDSFIDLGRGKSMYIDAGHHNFHTLDGNFAPFGKVAERMGFEVKSLNQPFNDEVLKHIDVLVIANALHEDNVNRWKKPIFSAFTADEVNVIRNWVEQGGRLFLIADHMPFAGAASELAQAFGFKFYDGFAFCKPNQRYDVFTLDNGMLTQHPLTYRVTSAVSFTGQAFDIHHRAVSIITLDSTYKLLMPDEAWKFS